MKKKTEEQRKNFSADYRIAVLSLIGLVGFIVGCFLLFWNDIFNIGTASKTIFREVKYTPHEIIADILKKPIDSLDKIITQHAEKIGGENSLGVNDANKDKIMAEKERGMQKNAETSNSAEAQSIDTLADLRLSQQNDRAILKVLKSYSVLRVGIDDDGKSDFDKLNKALLFNLTVSNLSIWKPTMVETKEYIGDSVKVYFKNQDVPFEISKSVLFEMTDQGTDIQFINKYPAVGVWCLSIMIFTSFCFISVANSINIAEKLKKIFEDNNIKEANRLAYYLCVVIVFVVLCLLNLLWDCTFYDGDVIKNIFFLPTLSSTMIAVILIGNTAGAFCLGGFIYTSGALGFVDDNIQSIKNEIIKIGDDSPKATPEEKAMQLSVQNSLLKSFNSYFLYSSAILSLMVLCTGGLYSLVNSLDFVKLLNDDWGYSPARMDFVLLYGGIHTVVLLLVYLPARMRFTEISVESNNIKSEDQSTTWLEIIKNPFASVKEVLMVASPLLASIVQTLLDILFGK